MSGPIYDLSGDKQFWCDGESFWISGPGGHVDLTIGDIESILYGLRAWLPDDPTGKHGTCYRIEPRMEVVLEQNRRLSEEHKK